MLRLSILLLSVVSLAEANDTAERIVSACKVVANARLGDDGSVALPKTSYDDGFDAGMCLGAFSVLDMALRIASDPPNRKLLFGVCIGEVTWSQEVKIFLEYANRNPKRLNEDFFFVGRDALKAAFPCRANGLP